MNTESRIVYGFCVSQCWGWGCMAESYRSTDFELSTTWSFLDKSWQALCSATDEEMSWAWSAICCVALHHWQPLPGLLVHPCPEQSVDTSYSKHRGSLGVHSATFLPNHRQDNSCYLPPFLTFEISHFREPPIPGIGGHGYYTTNT